MSKPNLILQIALAAGLLAPAAAFAASHDRDTFIREQDLDGDGRVSKEEFAKGRAAEFARMDKNGDGAVSEDEYIDDYRPRLEATLKGLNPAKAEEERRRQINQAHVRFGVLDSDGNDLISKAEFDYTGWGMFTHHETSGDGYVSVKDIPRKDDN